jgi:hypothetical protein
MESPLDSKPRTNFAIANHPALVRLLNQDSKWKFGLTANLSELVTPKRPPRRLEQFVVAGFPARGGFSGDKRPIEKGDCVGMVLAGIIYAMIQRWMP